MRAIEWRDDGVRMLDQRALPHHERYVDVETAGQVADAVRTMVVRGAPLLGIAAGFGVALAARRSGAGGPGELVEDLERAGTAIVTSRPTAVNIAWAVRRVLAAAQRAVPGGLEAVRSAAVDEALAIAVEDEQSCRAIGALGAELVPDEARILTHCNTGALATGGIGTALGVIATAHQAGKAIQVWVDETRPLLQGARLTAWELKRLEIPMTLVSDTAPGSLMARGLVDLVVVGADRIAANGDVVNKVGTYQLAVLAKRHRIPFYVAAPISTIDAASDRGGAIEIEERNALEVLEPLGLRIAPDATAAANPAFDVTPAELITAIVTDRGVARQPYRSSLRDLVRAAPGGRAWPWEAASA
jgi:methylthioribose-1-phosphate isomerase